MSRDDVERELLAFLREDRAEKSERERREKFRDDAIQRLTDGVNGLRTDFATHNAEDRERFAGLATRHNELANRLSELDGEIEDTGRVFVETQQKKADDEKKDAKASADFWRQIIVGIISSVVTAAIVGLGVFFFARR